MAIDTSAPFFNWNDIQKISNSDQNGMGIQHIAPLSVLGPIWNPNIIQESHIKNRSWVIFFGIETEIQFFFDISNLRSLLGRD